MVHGVVLSFGTYVDGNIDGLDDDDDLLSARHRFVNVAVSDPLRRGKKPELATELCGKAV